MGESLWLLTQRFPQLIGLSIEILQPLIPLFRGERLVADHSAHLLFNVSHGPYPLCGFSRIESHIERNGPEWGQCPSHSFRDRLDIGIGPLSWLLPNRRLNALCPIPNSRSQAREGLLRDKRASGF